MPCIAPSFIWSTNADFKLMVIKKPRIFTVKTILNNGYQLNRLTVALHSAGTVFVGVLCSDWGRTDNSY
jgi:hypothetical protein